MASIIRADISRILFLWAAAGHLLWLATPWGVALEQLLGPAWLWCGLMPGAAFAILAPRRLAAGIATVLGLTLTASCGLLRTVVGLRPLAPVMFLQGQPHGQPRDQQLGRQSGQHYGWKTRRKMHQQDRRRAGVVQTGGTGEQRR